jgi:hypothetical protein
MWELVLVLMTHSRSYYHGWMLLVKAKDCSTFLLFAHFLSFARVMDIPKIDLREVHLCFYSQEDIAQFRHDKWVEEQGFDLDDLYESDVEEQHETTPPA